MPQQLGAYTGRTSASFTRPADTTAYTAKDAVADSTSAPTVLSFANAARRPGWGGYIVGARLMTSQKANTARYRLHLFHTTPTAINDNSPQTVLYANRAKKIGVLDFPACQTEDSSGSTAAYANNFDLRIPFADATATIYALLETLDAFTPDNAQTFYLELLTEKN